MTNSLFLARAPRGPLKPHKEHIPELILESWDGSRQIPLNDTVGWMRLPGSTGLEMAPVAVVTSPIPGAHGSMLRDVRVEERPIFVPLYTYSEAGQVSHFEMMDAIRSLVDPLTGQFRLVGVTERSVRELAVVYTDGLEGADGRDEFGLWWRKFGLKVKACDPFAYDREMRTVEFSSAGGANSAFLGVAGGTDVPWPRSLASSLVIGNDMEIHVTSKVPVYPVLDLEGPMDSFTGSMSTGWSVSVPQGVPAGQTLRMVTNPREKSFRLGETVSEPSQFTGEPAAGRVARGSVLTPMQPGLNVLDVAAPGGTSATRIRLAWREAHWSLW